MDKGTREALFEAEFHRIHRRPFFSFVCGLQLSWPAQIRRTA